MKKWTREFDSPTPINPKLLGDKGANLAEMTRLGLPVPPGFTLTTKSWRVFNQKGKLPETIWQETLSQLKNLERKTGKKFADPENALIVSVRSGAQYSMPGMMDTILNIGLNQETKKGLVKQINEACAQDSYHRLKSGFKRIIGKKLPEDLYLQLRMAIEAVFRSWNNPRATVYREFHQIPHKAGTAATVQSIVFGNADENSGVGVFFTRSPQNGEKRITGEFVRDAQGEVVDGRGQPTEIPQELVGKLTKIGKKLEQRFRSPQDIEFTVQSGEIWLLQSRTLKGTSLARVKIAVDMVKEGLISQREAYRRVTSADIDFLLNPGFDQKAKKRAQPSLLAKGKPASAGTIVGPVAFTSKEAKKLIDQGKAAILVCSHLDPNNIEVFRHFKGLVATEGGTASHMALILQAMGKVGIVGVEPPLPVKKGEILSLDGHTGEIFRGTLPLAKSPRLSAEIKDFINLRREALGKSPWSTALYPTEKPYPKETFLKKIKNLKPELDKWPSDKAQTVILLNALLPQKEIIPAVVLRPDDTPGIRQALRKVAKQKGRQNIPRSCHRPEKLTGAPYVIIPTSEEIESFLQDPNYLGHPEKYGGLVKWKKDPTLVGIIIPAEPKGKISPDLASEHFCFTVSCLASWPPKIVVDLNLGTPLLRLFEQVESSQLIQITASLNPESPFYLGEIKFNFGKKYRHNRYARKVAHLVAYKVFSQWWQPPFSLPHVLSALDETWGLSVLEGQGRMKNKKELAWCLVYGAKGREEKEKVKETGR